MGGTQYSRAPAGRRFKPYPEYKDSGVEWLGKIPAHWGVQRAKALEKNAAYLVQTGPFGVQLHASDYLGHGDAGVPLILIKHVNDLAIVHEDLPQISEDTAGRLSEYRVKAGDIVFSRVGSVGRIGLVTEQESGWLISGQMLRLRFLNTSLLSSYALYAISSDSVLAYFDLMSVGTTRDSINTTILREMPLPLPSVHEQRAIADFLDRETAKIDALIAKKERLIELLQEKRTALITQAVTKGLYPNAPMKDSGIEWLGKIPAHWEVKKLFWLTDCLDGRRIPLNAEERGRMQGEFPYWGANSIVDHVDRWLFDEELVLLGEDGAPFFDRLKPVAFRVSGKIWVNNHAHMLRPTRRIDGSFLAFALNCVDYTLFIEGTTRDKLTQGNMMSIPIQCPQIPEQRVISAFLDHETAKIDSLVIKIREAIDRLKEYRTALISAAVTGKIDVRDLG